MTNKYTLKHIKTHEYYNIRVADLRYKRLRFNHQRG